jgi:hypothetical protein
LAVHPRPAVMDHQETGDECSAIIVNQKQKRNTWYKENINFIYFNRKETGSL